MADENFVSQIVNLLVSVLVLPVTCVALCVQVLIRQVFLWLCVCVCECELDATGVALSQTDKHNMRHYSKRLSRVCACVNVNLTLPVLPSTQINVHGYGGVSGMHAMHICRPTLT